MKDPLYNKKEEQKGEAGRQPQEVYDEMVEKGRQAKSDLTKETKQMGLDIAKKLHLDESAHPTACFFSFAFKVLAAVAYIFCSWILDDYIYATIFTVIIQAIDFYTVKNITGRILLGLRWWSKILEDGSEVWEFESRNTEQEAHKVDFYFFWGSMVIGILFWGIFGSFNILALRLKWATIDFVCLVLLAVNLFAFIKCSKEHQKKMKQLKKTLGSKTTKDGLQIILNKALNKA